MRRRARIDANHAEIVSVLRHMGCTVQSLASIGQGCPDILVGRGGRNWVFEIKDGRKAPSKRELTPDEQAWHDEWRGQVCVIECWEDAVEAMARI